MDLKNGNLLKRILIYILGFFLFAFGVIFSVKSNLGVSPVNSLPYTISLITGYDQGLLTTLIYCFYIVLQAVLLRRKFSPVRILQVIPAFLFGYLVSLAGRILAFVPTSENYIVRLLYLLFSMVQAAFGVLCYLTAQLVLQPPEGLTESLATISGTEFHKMKIVVDCTIVAISIALNLVYFHRLTSVREGTVIAAVGMGSILGIVMKHLQTPLKRFLEYSE